MHLLLFGNLELSFPICRVFSFSFRGGWNVYHRSSVFFRVRREKKDLLFVMFLICLTFFELKLTFFLLFSRFRRRASASTSSILFFFNFLFLERYHRSQPRKRHISTEQLMLPTRRALVQKNFSDFSRFINCPLRLSHMCIVCIEKIWLDQWYQSLHCSKFRFILLFFFSLLRLLRTNSINNNNRLLL